MFLLAALSIKGLTVFKLFFFAFVPLADGRQKAHHATVHFAFCAFHVLHLLSRLDSSFNHLLQLSCEVMQKLRCAIRHIGVSPVHYTYARSEAL